MDHNIYSGDNCICIRTPDRTPSSCRDVFPVSSRQEAASLAEMFKNGGIKGEAYVPAEDTERAYALFCAEFKEVNAAGGLVSDKEGRFLVIRRNGLWDLPKGHQEAGEDISVTAIREVSEETGVTGLELGSLLGITDHCYFREGVWHLKHTWWFRMENGSADTPEPQTEEGITEAVWIKAEETEDILKNTYPSIVDVFRMNGTCE